jgi:hypothetical protein
LKPGLVIDANGNRISLAYDALGVIVGMALMGKETEYIGNSLEYFQLNLHSNKVKEFFISPTEKLAAKLLGNGTSRQIYNRDRY